MSLLDPDGRTVYTRHIHAHEDKRLWFNPAFGAMDVLDDVMERVANYVARDVELSTAVHAVRSERLYGKVPRTGGHAAGRTGP